VRMKIHVKQLSHGLPHINYSTFPTSHSCVARRPDGRLPPEAGRISGLQPPVLPWPFKARTPRLDFLPPLPYVCCKCLTSSIG
jgi:hypothetical protein